VVSKGERSKLKITDDTRKLIRHAHPDLKRRIRGALQTILVDPSAGKSLIDDLAGLRSFRVGRTRIIYRLTSEQIIEVVTIGPRKMVYEETFKLISRKP
jgi:mRNA-degrading endonuclease RelE of RelBE toxin-antitoxin system